MGSSSEAKCSCAQRADRRQVITAVLDSITLSLSLSLPTYVAWCAVMCRYDKVKILLKEIQSCQYVACMNPTAGSFNITPRMQRHFATFAVQMPSPDIVRSIYLQILDGHLISGGFDADITKMSAKLVDATIELHRMVRLCVTWRPCMIRIGVSSAQHLFSAQCAMMSKVAANRSRQHCAGAQCTYTDCSMHSLTVVLSVAHSQSTGPLQLSLM